MGKIHTLKTINPFFSLMWEAKKTFDIRNNDRGFKAGDTIKLLEYDAEDDIYSGRILIFGIAGILKLNDVLNLYNASADENLIILSLEVVIDSH